MFIDGKIDYVKNHPDAKLSEKKQHLCMFSDFNNNILLVIMYSGIGKTHRNDRKFSLMKMNIIILLYSNG